MSEIRPIEFPKVDSTVLKKSGTVPTYSTNRDSGRKKSTESIKQGQQTTATASQPKVESSKSSESADEPSPPGIRFYNPRSVKVKNVPELGKHIDVRV